MSNPYYIQTETPASSFANALEKSLSVGMQVYGLREKGRLAELQDAREQTKLKEAALRQEQDYSLRKDTFAETLRQNKYTRDRQAQIDALEYGAPTPGAVPGTASQPGAQGNEIPVKDQNFGMATVTKLETNLKSVNLDKAFEPLTSYLGNLAEDPNMTNEAAMGRMVNDYGFFKPKIIEGLSKEYQTKAAKDPVYAQSAEGQELLKAIELFGKTDDQGNILEKTGDGTIIKKGNMVRDVIFQETWASHVGEKEKERVLAEGRAQPTGGTVSLQPQKGIKQREIELKEKQAETWEGYLLEEVKAGRKTIEEAWKLKNSPKTEAAYSPSFKGGSTGSKGEALSYDERTGKYSLAGTDTPYLGKVKTQAEAVKEIHFEKPSSNKMDEYDKEDLRSIRADKNNLTRQIREFEKLPNLKTYQSQRDQITGLKEELAELNKQEAALLGRGTKTAAPGAVIQPEAKGKILGEAKAREFLEKAKGDMNKARKMARDEGYKF